jgi:hypothetical protein
MGVFDALIAMSGGGCAMFKVEGGLGEVKVLTMVKMKTKTKANAKC